MTGASDIDLLVVRPNNIDAEDDGWRQQLAALVADVWLWTGNDLRVLEYSVGECKRGLARRDRVLLDIANDGVVVFGPGSYLRTRGKAK